MFNDVSMKGLERLSCFWYHTESIIKQREIQKEGD